MLEQLSGWIAERIKEIVPEHPASYAVLKFAIAVVLNVVFVVGFTLLVSLITGNAAEAGWILISFALLRQVSGGVHLKSGLGCVLFTTAMFTVISYVQAGPFWVQFMNGLSLLLVVLFAPSGIDKQTRIPEKHWPKLKFIAAVLVIGNIFIASPVIAASFTAQAVSLVIAWKKERGNDQSLSAQSSL
jgi:accessory gene regulator B